MNQVTQKLVIGSRVFCGLYGGRHGIIVAIYGEQRPETMRSIGVVSLGGNAEFDVVFDDYSKSHRVPESIIHGVQWQILDSDKHPAATTEEIALLMAQVAIHEANEKAKAEEASRAFAREVEQLRQDYPKLHQMGKDLHSREAAVKNIRLLLKQHWPGIKFSVRQDRGVDAISVGWTDGPTERAVEEITNKFRSGSFNGMEDIYEYSRSPWTTVFGGVQYITGGRDLSLRIQQHAIDTLWKIFPENLKGIEKPTPETLNWRMRVPDLNLDVMEAVNTLSAAWCDIQETWIQGKSQANRFLIEYAMRLTK
jgi:hypothetical protein